MLNAPEFFQKISLETTIRGVGNFTDVAAQMPADAFINIAYIGSDTLPERLRGIDQLLAAGLTPRPIVSARRLHSADETDTFLRELVKRGLRRVFLVGGDPLQPVGSFEGAMDLIEAGHLDNLPFQAIGLPAYPEGHPIIPRDDLMRHLLAKIAALTERGFTCDMTTQICLDPSAVVDWIRDLRERGVAAPIRVGVPSPTTIEAMLRFCRLCRVEASAEMLVQHGWTDSSQPERVNPDHFMRVLLETLAAENALADVHLHLYPMSSLPESLAWFHEQARQAA